jgi:hypothetical protein
LAIMMLIRMLCRLSMSSSPMPSRSCEIDRWSLSVRARGSGWPEWMTFSKGSPICSRR